MLEAFSDHPKGQGLNLCDGLIAIVGVAQHSRKGGHRGNPASVGFAVEFDRENHEANLHLNVPPNKRLQPTAARWIMRPPRLNRGR
jgi:hypothetical protein